MLHLAQFRLDLFRDVLFHLVEFLGPGRVRLEKHFIQPQRAERFAGGLGEIFVLAEDDFGAAAADIDDEEAFFRVGPAALDAEVDESCFFLPGDDLDVCAECRGGTREEFLLIGSVTDCGGGDGANLIDAQFSIGRGHLDQDAADEIHGFLADFAGFENAGAQACDLAFGGQDFRGAVQYFCCFHPERVTPDVDGGITRHS